MTRIIIKLLGRIGKLIVLLFVQAFLMLNCAWATGQDSGTQRYCLAPVLQIKEPGIMNQFYHASSRDMLLLDAGKTYHLTGEFRIRADKGRIAVPAAFRKQLLGSKLFVSQGAPVFLIKKKDNILCYPLTEHLNLLHPRASKALARIFYSGIKYEQNKYWGDVYVVNMDSQGRIIIPKQLRGEFNIKQAANILIKGKEILFELWPNPSSEEKISSSPITQFELEEEARYKQQLEMYIKNSDEKQLIKDVIVRRVMPQLEACEKILDIGSGDGAVTEVIGCTNVQEMWIVEPNAAHIQALRLRLEKIGANKYFQLNIINGLWQDAQHDIPEGFDLTVLSHMLYYIDPENVLLFLESVLGKLNSEGKLVIALNSLTRQSTVHGVYSQFFNQLGDVKKAALEPQTMIVEQLKKQGYEVETIPIEPVVATRDFEEFLEIGLFLLLEPYSTWSESEMRDIKDYLAACIYNEEYKLLMPQDIIIVGKGINKEKVRSLLWPQNQMNAAMAAAVDQSI
ncbi:MAG: hypothetical protein V1747_03715 [Candidatus Omnitrophota bacterium]